MTRSQPGLRKYPNRFAGLATVDLDIPMAAVRELRRRVRDDGFVGLRVVPWLWGLPPTDRRYYPLFAECVELGVPFCTQVGHTGPMRRSETGRPIPYIDEVALDFPNSSSSAGTSDTRGQRRWWPSRASTRTSTSTRPRTRRSVYPRSWSGSCSTGTGQRKVLFGTNYPMIGHQHALDGLDELGLTDETRHDYLHGNAERVFKLGR